MENNETMKSHGMNDRGVTRGSMHSGSHEMSREERMDMMKMHHSQTLWINWMLILLGIWMILSPLTFSYGKSVVMPSGGRSVWLELGARMAVMKWSDILSGVLLVFFALRTLVPGRPVSMWIVCFTGIWLSMAPLIFWSPSPAAYLNDTFVGMLVISLSILIPGMPGMMMYMKEGPEVPPGWSYNPSSWPQRWIMIATGFAGFVVSRYLAAFQLGYIDFVWDPFFGESSKQVLNSSMSQSLPVSDGGLGALAYTFEFLMGFMGGTSRWRTMPWMVTFFGILVIPLGLVHIFLVISQPLTVGAWCTFCLLAASIMLPMIPLEIDEVIAMGQHIKASMKRGEKFWPVFWLGGSSDERNTDKRTPDIMEIPNQFTKVFKASLWGMSAPWTLIITALFGIFIMSAPGIFGIGIQDSLADVNHLCGALVIVISVISMGEVVRTIRFLNIIVALALIIISWLTGDAFYLLKSIDSVIGILIIFLSVPRGAIREDYSSWNSMIK
jgi:hypothetical protein